MIKSLYRSILIFLLLSFLFLPSSGSFAEGTTPAPPTNLQVVMIGANYVSLSWDLPTDITNVDHLQYSVNDNNNFDGNNDIISNDANSTKIVNLSSDTDYTISIATCDSSASCATVQPAAIHTLKIKIDAIKNVPNLGDSLSSGISYTCNSFLFTSDGINGEIIDVFDTNNPMMPKKISSLVTSNRIISFTSSADCRYLYFGTGYMGTSKLNVADMTNILHPVLAFSSTAYSSYNAISPITVQGDYLFAGGNGLLVFNLSNPIAPELASSVVRTSMTDNTIFANNDTVIVTYAKSDGSNFIDIFNVSDKSQPILIKEIVNTSGQIKKMVVNNNIAYFSTSPANDKSMGIGTLDFSDPANSSITDQIFLSDTYSGLEYQGCSNLVIKDNKLYALSYENIYVVDISSRLVNLGLMTTGLQGSNDSMVFNGDYLYLFGFYFNNTTFNIFDLSPEKVSIDKSTTTYGPVKSGDLVEYDIVINNPTDKEVTNTKIVDPIPAGMTYMPNSATVNGEPVTDGSDSDFFSITNSRPTWNFGTLTQSGQENSHYIVSFKVKVN